MTEQITLEQATELVSFKKRLNGTWKVLTVYDDVHGDVIGKVSGSVRGSVGEVVGNVYGNVYGYVSDDVCGDVYGSVGTVHGTVHGHVHGTVNSTINGREWQFVETPLEKLERLIQESGDQELIEAFNQQQQEENN
jgi:hypothetical protein